ncbi:glycosyltransferase [Flavobacterium muglaense]|uniref:Glycosyltransferase family 4 protein n=1 Tax=Flavobacterium muglaense TaxID=2764716 RepID=A0A923SEK3_9FLAO|nr:glycosyltransferase [Flavobacterium muglaense]MBC5837082.1 glycosyltransferase family 4 protein [Flavobacterium muglaense]MBC5843611.1 glycosyltransferase family 4 protein [Flavobacterium muglaense]
MRFLILTHVPHIIESDHYFAYAPYVREMNIWTPNIDDVVIVAPVDNSLKTAIHLAYEKQNIRFISIENFDVLSLKGSLRTFVKIPKILWILYKSMRQADHIHLRCPGNIGLLACFVQILFPNKKKTAKYAGNWDPKSKQPWTYKLQQKILQNTFLTRNMQVLIYGTWEGQTKNCKSFFTASYFENEKKDLVVKNLDSTIRFMFVGALVKGKNPLYAIRLVEGLIRKGFNVGLDLYGDGIERNNLEAYIAANSLSRFITLQGNQDKEALKKAYQQSHFTLLPSESEGWPKAIAEAMFWGSVPVATAVSCVPFMLDYESRGVLLTMNINDDIEKLITILQNNNDYKIKQKRAFDWSQQYTLDLFETEIKKLLI